MDKIFKELRTKAGAEKIINKYVGELFEKGGTDFSTLEVLAHIKESYPSLFEKYEQRILVRLGLFFKNPKITTFEDSVFKIYKEHIEKTYKESFTPIQADVISKINRSKFFSFSSPTSTGKSYIFRYLISTLKNDMAIIVPSRALINEYCKLVTEIINDKTVNVLTFVDKINTKRATRNIFIITPERTKDLFTMRNEFNIGMILFDEAQLSDDKGIRGMYYDSVIRRAIKYFQTSKFVFAYPFIKNPEGQFRRNSITTEDMVARKYDNKNVGQIFYLCQENKKNRSTNDFYKFGISQALFGNKIVAIDPLKEVLDSNGVALIFCSKESIKQGRIFKKFASYIDQKSSIKNTEALGIIDEIRTYIGASGNNYTDDYWSSMVHNMRKGIVIHHGSLPLRVRILIEKFVNSGYCKICFATATLEQGINMPFDLVWIERWSGHSTIIDNKNLIGRAGRSSNLPKFDYGKVVTKNMTKMRAIVNEEIFLETVSQLDRITDEDDDYKDYKEAIRNGTFSEEYNLANTEIERLKERRTIKLIDSVLESLFDKDGKVHFENLKGSEEVQGTVEEAFIEIYEHYLNRRLGTREREILSTTVKILFWRVQNKRFNEIVQKRYSFAAQTWNRRLSSSDAPSPRAGYLVRYDMIPLKKERRNAKVPSLTAGLNASEVDYDAIVTDTYDFIDKLIGFRVGDVYIAAFDLYSKNEKNDINLRAYAKSITNLIRYGTDDKKEIWMLRYGFDFEDFEWLSPLIMSINQEEIIFECISKLNDKQLSRIEKYI